MSVRVEQSPLIAELHGISPLDPDVRTRIEQGVTTEIYGPYLEAMIRYGIEGVKAGILNGELTGFALCDAAMLYTLANDRYRKGEHYLTGEALRRHQNNVLTGVIELVPAEAATTCEEGIRQVTTANALLSGSSAIEPILAVLNYGRFFREKTMASVTRTLDRRGIDSLLAAVDRTQEAMPHLSVTNWAIGQIIAGIYHYASRLPFGRVRGFDIGSGYGATEAATTNSIVNLQGIVRRPGLALTCLEATPEFYRELIDFVNRDPGIAELNLRPVSQTVESNAPISTYGALTTVQGDALTSLQGFDLTSGVRDADITVVTANYSWHRFPRSAKVAIMEIFRPLNNVIFVIGDLAQNTSAINRRYFNLAVNGPLNCGNLYLAELFQHFDYQVVDMTKTRPASLDPRIARRIVHDRENDGHLWIAYWGKEASEALNLVSNN